MQLRQAYREKNLKMWFRDAVLFDKFRALSYSSDEIQFDKIFNELQTLNSEFYNELFAMYVRS